MERGIYEAKQIAQWFVNRAALDAETTRDDTNYISNLKIQKLLYYAQACSMATKNRKLFNERIEAWKFGPVVKKVYDIYKVCSNKPVTYKEPVILDEETCILLEFVYQHFANSSPMELVEMTHQDKSYGEAKQHNNIYNDEKIKNDFEEKWLKDVDIEEKKDIYSSFAETAFINSSNELSEYLKNQDTEEAVEVDWKKMLNIK